MFGEWIMGDTFVWASRKSSRLLNAWRAPWRAGGDDAGVGAGGANGPSRAGGAADGGPVPAAARHRCLPAAQAAAQRHPQGVAAAGALHALWAVRPGLPLQCGAVVPLNLLPVASGPFGAPGLCADLQDGGGASRARHLLGK
eukprot:3957175-Pyramimonas_sp.AAC.1